MKQLRFNVPDVADDALNEFARENRIDKAEALQRAIALLAISQAQKKKGRYLAIAEGEDNQTQVLKRVAGV